MAHNLNFNSRTGNYSFFSVKEKPWYNLGQIVEEHPTSEQAIKFAGLDYEVEKSPLLTKGSGIIENNNGIEIIDSALEVPNYFANIRTDNNTVLGVVGKDYQIVQNREAFSFFDSIVGGGDGILYETAGALGNGERIFITAKLPDYIRVGNGDDITEKYIFLTTSHDGSGSITAAFTPIRIVCQNTLNPSLKNMSNDYDELRDRDEAEYIGSIIQTFIDFGDICGMVEAYDKVQMSYDLQQLLDELEDNGYYVFGERDPNAILPHISGTDKWVVATLIIRKKENPEIYKVNL
ncbi:hypothetical protein J2795_003002 [Chryseobacterium bernardetii]|uniref:Uncharacterized protein n=1 Tax=Chryseobacterium bernardetii TaxID=1241978 RepID=A0ACC6IXD3_9FLAO|nr:hypothetical protein [Chryseobacterium vietnamense]MDR6442277.1 hypothetical protein [Chryseobacterium bernardetii]